MKNYALEKIERSEDSRNKVKELRGKLLSREEVGEIFDVKPNTIYKWELSDSHWIKPVKRGRYVRYRVEDVEAYLEGKYTGADDKEK